MRMTLTYRGELPAKRRGVSPVKAALREHFHPQIHDQVSHRLWDDAPPYITSTLDGHDFLSPAHDKANTAVELEIVLLVPRSSAPVGDPDNRTKTLVDGLTRPQTAQQMQGFTAPAAGGPTYCLLDDDGLVQRLGVDVRPWFDPTAKKNEVLVLITATVVGSNRPGSRFSHLTQMLTS